jgi:hypothetical protein
MMDGIMKRHVETPNLGVSTIPATEPIPAIETVPATEIIPRAGADLEIIVTSKFDF